MMDSPHKGSKCKCIYRPLFALALTGQVADVVPPYEPGLKFEARLLVTATGGKLDISDEGTSVENADDAVLLLVAATSYKTFQDITADPAQRCDDCIATLQRQRDMTP